MMLRHHLGLGGLLALIACAGPTAPDPTIGITVFPHPGYGGGFFNITVDYRDLGTQANTAVGNWCCVPGTEARPGCIIDCISSIRVAPGWRAIVYPQAHFLGGGLEVTADIPDLSAVGGPCDGTFNDCIRSVQIRRP